MTAPRRSGAEQATTRGLIVLFVAVVLGAGLLAKSGSIVGSTEAGKSKPATTTTTTKASDGTTPSTVSPIDNGESTTPQGVHPAAEVHVVVVNASGKTGVGSKNQQLISAAKYKCESADVKTGRPLQATTTVYFAAGYQADAEAVKAAIAVPTAKVTAQPATPAITEAGGAKITFGNVTVVFGQDYQV